LAQVSDLWISASQAIWAKLVALFWVNFKLFCACMCHSLSVQDAGLLACLLAAKTFKKCEEISKINYMILAYYSYYFYISVLQLQF
jgi:hypothetical protein